MARALLSPRPLLLAVLGLAALYGWWVVGQYQQLASLNQRELGDAALELRNSIDTAFENIRLYEPRLKMKEFPACEFDGDQPYLETGSCRTEWTRWLKPHLALDSGVDVLATRGFAGEDEALARADAEARLNRETAKGDKVPALPDPKTDVRFTIRVDLLLGELPFTKRFERIFLVDRNGRVLYQEDPSLNQRLRLLRWGERGFRDAQAGQTHGLQVQSMASLIGKDAVPDWPRLSAVSDRTSVQLGGTRMQLYTHPIAIEEAGDAELVLVGVVPFSVVLRQALAIDTGLLAPLVFLALLGALGFPFIKLVSLDPHERFGMRDVKWLYVSSAALLIVLTFAVLAGDAFHRWNGAADRGLRELAGDVQSRLLTEIEQLRTTLHAHDQAVLVPEENPLCQADKPVFADWFNRREEASDAGFTTDRTLFLDQVAWVGPDGRQIWKITSDHIGEKVNVVRRAYYRAVRDGNLFATPSGGPSFFIGPDRSITDGKFYTFLSMRSALTGHCPDAAAAGDEGADHEGAATRSKDPYVVVATARLMTMDRPPLPLGYGLAVLNREGRVLYHSDQRLSLRENFVDQLTDAAAARALIYANNRGLLSTRYRQTPHRVLLQPLSVVRQDASGWPSGLSSDPSGLYLAVFRDVSLERAVVSRAFLVSLLGPFPFLLAVIAAGMWATGYVAMRIGVGRDDWLWPHATYDPLYRRQFIAYAATLVAVFVLARTVLGAWAFVLLPVAAIAGGLFTYARHSHHKVPRRTLVNPRWHLLQFALLGTAVVLAPASAMFDTTMRHEFGTLVDTEQRWIADQIEDIRPEMEAEARAEGVPVRIGTDAALARRMRLGRWPEPFDAAPAEFDGATRHLLRVHQWVDQWVPFGNEGITRLRYQRTEKHFTPPGFSEWPIGRVGLLGLVLLAIAMVAWLHVNSTHLLYANVASAPELHPHHVDAAWNAASMDEKHVMMQIAREGIANPRRRQLVNALIDRGLVRLSPNLQLSSPELNAMVKRSLDDEPAAQALQAWERAHDGHNWHDTKTMLIVALAFVALLVATQPGLPQELAGLASGVTMIGGAGLKLREMLGSWMERVRKS